MDPSQLPSTGRDPLPRQTTPTWEMELLISGATVFALMQLPAAVDAALYRYVPQLEHAMASLLMTPYLYVMTASYALIATFILHLAARGYWVALVGLRSVYPDGVRWSAMKWGPHYRSVILDETGSNDSLIERADNRASLVFGYGIGFALVMIAPLAMVLVLAVAVMLLHAILGHWLSWTTIWLTAFALLMLPFAAAVMTDRWAGHRIESQTRAAGFLRSLFRGYLRAGFSSFVSYPVLMFISRMGEKRGTVVMMLTMFALLLLVSAQLALNQRGLSFGGYRYLPGYDADSSRALLPDHYADRRRSGASLAPLPYIPSEVIRGPYLRVFIPYRPSRDTLEVERRCGVASDRTEAAPPLDSPAAMLDCLARTYALRIDGDPVTGVHLDVSEDLHSGQRGVVAMLPVGELAPGRHLLEIARAPHPERRDEQVPPHRIPFWR